MKIKCSICDKEFDIGRYSDKDFFEEFGGWVCWKCQNELANRKDNLDNLEEI